MTVESEQKRKMTCEDTGRKGRLKVARERGPEFCREIGRKGGEKWLRNGERNSSGKLEERTEKTEELNLLGQIMAAVGNKEAKDNEKE